MTPTLSLARPSSTHGAAQLFQTLAQRAPAVARHSVRVANCCSTIAARVELPPAETHLLLTAAYLHDIGKMLLPGDLLDKPGKLSPAEWERIQAHSVSGAQLAFLTHSPEAVCEAIRHHHERWDGRGYPDGLAGERIPFLAQVLTLADSFVTMMEGRPYQAGKSPGEVRAEVLRCRGTQFSPGLVDAWLPESRGERHNG